MNLDINKHPGTLSERMKSYESAFSIRLITDEPVIIRIDGKGFGHYTQCFNKPFDNLLVLAMQHCAEKVFTELQGCKLAYCQSDEISFLVTKNNENSDICFGGKVNKINSICSSYMTGYFNSFIKEYAPSINSKQLAFFDSRCFNVPANDISNYFLSRAKDWERNSITMLGRHYFSHKEMHGKSRLIIKDWLLNQKGINWDSLSEDLKYGSFIHNGSFGYLKTNVKPYYAEIEAFIQDIVLKK